MTDTIQKDYMTILTLHDTMWPNVMTIQYYYDPNIQLYYYRAPYLLHKIHLLSISMTLQYYHNIYIDLRHYIIVLHDTLPIALHLIHSISMTLQYYRLHYIQLQSINRNLQFHSIKYTLDRGKFHSIPLNST